MGLGSIAIKGVTKLKGLFIKTSGKLGASAGKETAEELAIQGGRKISREMAEQGIKKGSIKTEAYNLANKVLSSKTASTTGKVLLATGGVAGATALTGAGVYGAGYGVSKGIDFVKTSYNTTSEQSQRAKDIELAKEELKIQTDYDKLMNEQREKDLKYFEDYKKLMGDSGDTMSYDEFKAWLEEQNANRSSDLDNIIGSSGSTGTTTNNSKWLYLLGGLGLVGAGYYIYKKGKKGKK